MNIISGKHRGRKLKAPKGLSTRPVLGKIRGALFNVLGDMDGIRFLDLFAGTGAVGLEALSRGAESSLFVEKGDSQCRIIRENLQTLDEHAKVKQSDVLKALHRMAQDGDRYDVVFADPPYEMGLSQKTALEICGNGVLSEQGLFAVTVGKREEMPDAPGDCTIVFDRRYGDTRLLIYGRSNK